MIVGLASLAVLFIGCALLTLGFRGLRVIAALAAAAVALCVVLPALVLRGMPPLWVALPAAVVIATAGLCLIGGLNRKSLAAAAGATSALLLAALLPVCLRTSLKLTGLDVDFGPSSHLDLTLWYEAAFGKVDFAQLLIAGIILASLGATMDVAMTIVSTVQQLMDGEAPPAFRARFAAGVRVGGKVLGPMLATMLLVFLGAELAVNVARSVHPGTLWDTLHLLNFGEITSEVLETLAAGLGLLLCIPLTALCAAAFQRTQASVNTPPASEPADRLPAAGGRA